MLSGNSINCPVRVMDSCIIASGGGKFLKFLNIQPSTTGQTTTIAGALNVASTLYFALAPPHKAATHLQRVRRRSGTFPATLNMGGGGTWTITGDGQSWKVIPGISVLNSGGGTIKLTDATATTKSFSGGNATYATLSLLGGADVGFYQIFNNNSFTHIIIETNPAQLLFAAGSKTVTAATGADQR